MAICGVCKQEVGNEPRIKSNGMCSECGHRLDMEKEKEKKK